MIIVLSPILEKVLHTISSLIFYLLNIAINTTFLVVFLAKTFICHLLSLYIYGFTKKTYFFFSYNIEKRRKAHTGHKASPGFFRLLFLSHCANCVHEVVVVSF